MKLSEAMKDKMLLSFELFPPKTDKVWKIFQAQLNICANTSRLTFPVHMALVEQT